MKKVTTLGAALGFLGLGASAFAQFTGGNLVVSVIRSSGTTAPTNVANARVLLEVKTDMTLTGKEVIFPTTVVGANRRLTDSGSATSNGFISVSTDGRYILAAGYDAAVDSAGVTGTTSAAVNRVIGRYEWSKAPTDSGALDTTTFLTNAYSGNNFRSVASVDGTGFWTAGNGSGTGAASTGGVRYIPYSATPSGLSVLLAEPPTNTANTRVVKINAGQLYVSTASGNFIGINTVGTGLPTTTGQNLTRLPFDGATAATSSAYDYSFEGDSIIYVADDGNSPVTAPDAGLQKWVKGGDGIWVKTVTYTIPGVLTGTVGLRGLTRESSTVYYATTSEATKQRVVKIVLTGNTPTDATVTTVYTAADNEAVRDVKLLPVSAFTVGGTIQFQTGLENVPRNQPLFLTFTPTGSTGGGIINQTVTPAANGNFTSTAIPNGTYRLKVKTTYTLSEAANVTVNNGNVSGVNFTLRGGDSNSDNVVDVTDLLAIINSYNQKRDMPANNANYKEGADVNSDGVNDVADLLLIINNYNKLGNS